MGRKRFAKLTGIEQNTEINRDNAAEFLFQLETGLLLALKEEGMLTQMQYRHAESALKKERHEYAKKKRGGKQ